MNRTGKSCFITFTVLGLALTVLMILNYYGSGVYLAADHMIAGHEGGVYRLLSWLFRSDWTSVLVQYVFAFGIPYFCAYCIMRFLPVFRGPAKKFSLEEFMVCLVIASGLGYILNMGGNLINAFFSLFNGKTFEEMNPITEVVTDYTPSMVIYICLLGPFMEELMFRGLLLKRARVFGDRTAVVFCAVMFGLMHGNLPQFLYATFVGLVLGYIAVTTNRIRYNVILHMIFNSYTMITTAFLFWLEEHGLFALSALYSLALMAVMALQIVGAVYFAARYAAPAYKKLTAANGAPYRGRIFAYLNPGFAVYLIVCTAEILSFLL